MFLFVSEWDTYKKYSYLEIYRLMNIKNFAKQSIFN
jgi:hypothetical protein